MDEYTGEYYCPTNSPTNSDYLHISFHNYVKFPTMFYFQDLGSTYDAPSTKKSTGHIEYCIGRIEDSSKVNAALDMLGKILDP